MFDDQNEIISLVTNQRCRNQFFRIEINIQTTQRRLIQLNIEILKDLAQKVMFLKDNYNQLLEKLNNNILEWILAIKQQMKQMEDRLGALDIHNYLQQKESEMEEFQLQQMKNIIQISFEKVIKSQLVEECISTLQKLDDSVIKLTPYTTQNRNEKSNDLITPLVCKEHNKEIIFFNLEEQIDKRIVCPSCINKKKGGEYLELSEVKRLWKEYILFSQQLSIRDSYDQKQKEDIAEEILLILKTNLENIIREAVTNIQANKQREAQLIQKINSQIDKDWQTLTYEYALEVAEKLSKYNQLLQSKEGGYQENQLDLIIQNCTEKLKIAQKQCFEKAKAIIHSQNLQFLSEDTNILFGKKEISCQTENEILQLNQQIVNIAFKREISNITINYKIVNIACGRNKLQLKVRHKILSVTLKLGKKLKLNKSIIQQSFCPLQIQKNRPINYQLVKGDLISQHEWCRCMAFNKQSTLMVAACDKKIRIFSFKLGILQQVQVLTDHTGNVLVLLFLKNSNNFISAGEDNTIRIWSISNIQLWSCVQSWSCSGPVNCVIINRAEDLMISSTSNGFIQIWKKSESWGHSDSKGQYSNLNLKSLSFNGQENQFVILYGQEILIFSQKPDKSWSRINSIPISKEGYRLCFIDDNLITFQPFNAQIMEIYQMSDLQKKFVKSTEAKVESYQYCHYLFPQIFNIQKQMLMNKNGETVHMMKKQGAKFKTEQAIKFGTECVFGTMTNDGEYLATWDAKSLQFQVRKQQ